MKLRKIIIPVFAFLFLSCENSTVSRAEYNALFSEKQRLEALNDSLQFEISNLKLHNDYLITKLDSLQNN